MDNYHVTRHSDGSWQVLLGTGSKKAIKKFKTQLEALDYAKELAESREATVYLHGRNGRVRDTFSFSQDPTKTSNRTKPVTKEPVVEKKVEEKNVTPKKEEVKEEKKIVEPVQKEEKEEVVKEEHVEETKEEVKEESKVTEPVVEKKVEETASVQERKEEVATPKKKSHVFLYILLTLIVIAIIALIVIYFVDPSLIGAK